jgi:riboflavin kinase/FMN adenylyltransferase
MPCLTTPGERCDLLAQLGVDHVITQHFDRVFADQTALDFMRLAMSALGVRHLVLGYDTALGRGREGTATRLEEIGHELGYTVEVFPPFHQGEEIISSSAIRQQLVQGDVEAAAQLLGRLYSVSGKVIHGDGRGRHINLPTANLDYPTGKLLPASGIYATWAWVDGERLRGATNIGTNPTFTPQRRTASLESHLLNFDRDLYGKEIRLEFATRLRAEMKYDSVEALLEQIRSDIERTRQVLT